MSFDESQGQMISEERCVCISTSGNAKKLPVSTSELLERIKTGDEAALAKLYDSYSHLVYSVALKALQDPAKAEDVLQDVFVNLWRRSTGIAQDVLR